MVTDLSAWDVWGVGEAYEAYVGRWSRLVARQFLPWLGVEAGARWLDVGCGTGMLTRAILEVAAPHEVAGVDSSEGFLGHARRETLDARARFEVADALDLPFEADAFDAVVSGLVLNFVGEPARALQEMTRVAGPGAVVAAYVWDYAEGMQLMRYLWDAAVAVERDASELDEGRRFPICRPDALRALFEAAGLRNVEVRAVDVPTVFRDFEDYWTPFLGGQGSAPGYIASLDEDRREAVRSRVQAQLPIGSDGSIHLEARAWAVRGRR